MSGLRKNKDILKVSVPKRRRLGGESGSALVEMALSAAVIFALFFGIIEFGFALYAYQYVDEAARQLTRYAIVNGSACTAMPNCGFTDSSTTLQTYARSNYIYPGLDPTKVTVKNTWYAPVVYTTTGPQNGTLASWSACGSGTGCNGPGDLIQVTVSYPFLLNIPFWRATTLTVSSTSSMVISQ
jgi:Flp pilus assembly protein TadG